MVKERISRLFKWQAPEALERFAGARVACGYGVQDVFDLLRVDRGISCYSWGFRVFDTGLRVCDVPDANYMAS